MATIPRAAVEYLTKEINTLSADAQAKVLRVLEQISWTPENIAECRDLVLETLRIVLPEYTTLSAQAAADFYDAERELCVGEAMGATAVSGYEQERTEKAVRSFVKYVVDGKPIQTFNDAVLQRIDYEMKRSSGNSMFENGRVDPLKPRFARVPAGPETCDFCLMLASRGFAYRTEEAASNYLDHYHSGCDCEVVAGWDDDSVEGYDTKDIYKQWQDRIDEIATENAEKRGTTFDEERAKILRGYKNSAAHAKKAGSSTS